MLLNNKNKLIIDKNIKSIFKKYNTSCKIKNINIFQTAFVHNSYTTEAKTNHKIFKLINNVTCVEDDDGIPLMDTSYERLEFLGDSVIHLIIANYLYIRFPNENEGFMTKLRTKIENGDTLSNLALKLELQKYIIIAKVFEQIGARLSANILEDVFEAFIGAVYVDMGFDICYQFVTNVIEKELNLTNMIVVETNFKDLLIQYFHQKRWNDPVYNYEKNLNKNYIVTIRRKESAEIYGKGEGNTKKIAEKNAAKNACIKLNLSDNLIEEDDDYFVPKV